MKEFLRSELRNSIEREKIMLKALYSIKSGVDQEPSNINEQQKQRYSKWAGDIANKAFDDIQQFI